MKGRWAPHALVAVVCALIAAAPIAVAQAPSGGALLQVGGRSQSYPTTSWAVGVVVPQGADLQGGGRVAWDRVSNVTALATLPNITRPDGIVYAVVSLMTGDGTVLQAAVGIWPNDSTWSAYSWLISGADAATLTYDRILNDSPPAMAPGSGIGISIYFASGAWNLRIWDPATGDAVGRSFPGPLADSLKVGDQEVFALESYTRSSAAFHDMGNLTLSGLFLDGSRVTGGVYAYSDWAPNHSPLFAVGSSGTSPPPFISFGRADDGSFVWGYAPVWNSGGDSVAMVWVTGTVVTGAILIGAGAAVWGVRHRATPPRTLTPKGRFHL